MSAERKAFRAYCDYLAVQSHFDASRGYDFHKYHGKTNAKIDGFRTRKDKFKFLGLSKVLPEDQFALYYAVQAAHNDGKLPWIGELLHEERFSLYNIALGRFLCLDRIVVNEVQKVLGLRFGEWDAFVQLFVSRSGRNPQALDAYYEGELSIEVICALSRVLKFTKHWKENIEDTLEWPNTLHLITKYEPFIEKKFDKKILDEIKSFTRKDGEL